ncbi:metal-dependent transcriptional regulator [Chrysiogenes arsenatis]|uniref:metal-dependent transcriptional regulator n=1 Tax=Chrysiogenes arsenatis TaxID=309797 RepID=UPI0004193F95|nr:metal-dependent transcriptional regulator [Chrysiogenes arsenatis]
MQQDISSSMEDYLEAIYTLTQRDHVARTRDIAKNLNVKMPSVTSALKKLSEHGLVNYDPYQYITLTDQGEKLAKQTLQKHRALTIFFQRVVALNEEMASRLACQLEHHIDMKTLDKFRKATPAEES